MEENLVYMKGITKYFGKVCALDDVYFSVKPQEIVGLVGDNGAGKSTLIKILCGVYKPNNGEIYFSGRRVLFNNPKEAIEAGIETTHQDLALVDDMNIYRNIFMGRELKKSVMGFLPVLNKEMMIDRARLALENIGVHIGSVKDYVKNLSGGQKQSVAVGRATYFKAKLVIMDEPTAAMSLKETKKILELMIRLKETGSSVIFISHNVHQVFSIADKITILSHGHKIADIYTKDTTEDEISNIIMNN
ncbi:sugar ABC transporter ATP-binding protein [candidate division WOR-3 bacterium]|nr:sugar ABC transporter ATP-binding protein [candidate division WOR-3 bacterium]